VSDDQGNYLLRRWKRVRFSIFLCFFFRMRLRRFLINDPMAESKLAVWSGAKRNGQVRPLAWH
jgi:hypothetical protein